MLSRLALGLVLIAALGGCVTSGGATKPLSTSEGRQAAHDAYIQLGLGYFRQGSTEQAKEPLRKALELNPSSAEAHAALAVVYQRELEPKLADESYRKAISLSNGETRILNNYGGFLFEQKRYAEAFENYLKASQDTLYGERSRVFENLGLTAQQLSRRDEAKHYFERALRLNNQRVISLLQMALIAYGEKDYQSAASYYSGYVQQAPQTAESLLLGSRLARVYENRDQAATLGLQLRRLYPGSSEYQQYLAEQ